VVEIVKIDRSNRVVVPKSIRRELGMEKGGQFLVSAMGRVCFEGLEGVGPNPFECRYRHARLIDGARTKLLV